MILASLAAALALAAAAAEPPPPETAQPGLERAMSAELTRASRDLREDGYPPIYFAQLTVWDLSDWDEWSHLGAPRAEATMRQRIAMADVRVGSPALDNHPETPRADYLGTPIAMSDDEFAIRHALWRMFDGDYKSATSDFLNKQAETITRGRADYETDDLSAETAIVSTSAAAPRPWSLERLRLLSGALGDPLRAAPWLLEADTHAGLRRLRTRLRSTDGLFVDKTDDWAKIEAEAVALSSDGYRETVSRDWHARGPDALPSEYELRRAGEDMVRDLAELRTAITTSPFSAPALLDPSAAAAVVYALGESLSGEEQRNPSGAQTFRGRLGERVLSADLSLIDDPTESSFRGRPLFGAYQFDDQGVPAQHAPLIVRGRLRGFLLSRYPVKGFARSNGHGRAPLGQMPAGAPGNLFLTTQAPVTRSALLDRLRAECRRRAKPYGLWVRRLRGWSEGESGQGSIRLLGAVYLVAADSGKIVRVRDLDLVGTPLVMAESVLAAGDDPQASDLDAGVPASVVTPSLLLSDAELQRSETKPERAPILPPPQRPTPIEETAATGAAAALIEVDRFRLSGRETLLDGLAVPGLLAWRQTVMPGELVVDAKVTAADARALRRVERRLARAVASAVDGGVRKVVLFPAEASAVYRKRFGDGWPDLGPR